MSQWNLDYMRKIAGLAAAEPKKQLNERWDDDDYSDDEDPDVKIAGEDKAQKAFEKRNKKELKSASSEADKKAAEAKAKKAEEKKPEPKAEEKKPEPKAEEKPAEKKEEAPAAEAKRRGKAPNENSFNQQAKKYAQSHTRGSFIKWAAETHGKGKNYASALFAKYNPKSGREQKVQEASVLWGVIHPFIKGFVLAENREMNQMQWIDSTSPLDPVLCLTEAEAQSYVKHMSERKGQSALVEKYDFSDDE